VAKTNDTQNQKKFTSIAFIKNRPKIFVAILFIIIFATIGTVLYTLSRAIGTATFTISPSSSALNVGSTLTITITENSGSDLINAVQADLTYDQTKLQFVSIDTTVGVFNNMVVQKTGGNGVVNISAAVSPSVSGSQVVARITFTTIASGAAAINFANTSAIVKALDQTNVLGTMTGGNYIIDNTAPSVPTGLNVTSNTINSITLRWTASTDNVAVTGYRIYRGGTQVGTSPTTTYIDTGLTLGTTYSYTVAAYDAAGNVSAQTTAISYKIVDATPPSTPSGLTMGVRTPTSISINWTASTDNVAVTGYIIYRGGTQVGTSPTTTYIDTGLTPGSTYSYTVAAYDATGNVSAQSTVTPFTTVSKKGDINGDGVVNISDLSILATNFTKSNMTWSQGDLNADGVVNVYDLSILAVNWGI